MKREVSFLTGCLLEAALLVLAFFWCILFNYSFLPGLRLELKATILGIAAAIPPFLFFLFTLKSNCRICVRHRQMMEVLLRPMFAKWSILQSAFISLLAGVCEEALFRGAIQGSLAERVGMGLALALTSLLFGAAHLVTWTYGIMAALIAAYLGLLWIWTNNLLAPMVAHGVYDFVALVYFLKVRSPAKDS